MAAVPHEATTGNEHGPHEGKNDQVKAPIRRQRGREVAVDTLIDRLRQRIECEQADRKALDRVPGRFDAPQNRLGRTPHELHDPEDNDDNEPGKDPGIDEIENTHDTRNRKLTSGAQKQPPPGWPMANAWPVKPLALG